MSNTENVARSISETISDYRKSDDLAPTVEHVLRWVSQFPEECRLGLLNEVDHVLKKTYFSLSETASFLEKLLVKGRMISGDPDKFWEKAHFLDIQQHGASQAEMLTLIDSIMKKRWGIERNDDPQAADRFIYVDDAIFSGGHVFRDLSSWVEKDAPETAEVHVVVIAFHESSYYNRNKLIDASQRSGKNIKFSWWHLLKLEDRRAHINSSDVLRPVEIPDNRSVREYVESLRYPPALRTPGLSGETGVFSSESGRHLMEQQFLVSGAKIRRCCPDLNRFQRPLGNSVLDTLGFGSTVVTFRNCPNNAPLAFWAGDPWYPLFPRVTNSETSLRKMEKMLEGIEF